MLKVYLGYDPAEHEAWEVAAFSLRRRASVPVLVTPVYSQNPLYRRTWHQEGTQRVDDVDGKPFSTEFSFARFLVPACEKYTGFALFADCDFLFLADVAELLDLANPDCAVQVVQHRHEPKREKVKMEGQAQGLYPRKNWSSLILWNCGHPANQAVTPDMVNEATGAFLHGFRWLQDAHIGDLAPEWNHLVDYDPLRPEGTLKALHYTSGGPWLAQYRNCGYASLWRQELAVFNASLATTGQMPSKRHVLHAYPH